MLFVLVVYMKVVPEPNIVSACMKAFLEYLKLINKKGIKM